MSSRALSLATVLLLIGFGAADTVLAQATNLEAGKTPSQLFAQTCNVCHKSPRGLLKSVAPGSLPGFLRQHYTTSSDMAGVLASYLVSNGATDTRYQAKDGKKDGAKEKDANAAPGQSPEHHGRRQRAQDAAKEGVSPEGQAAPEGRKSKRRAKPEDASKADSAAPASEDKKSESKPETVKPDSAKVEPEAKPEGAKAEPRGSEAAAPRPDPVPQVTPATPSAAPKPAEEAAPPPAAPAASSEPTPAAKPQESAPPATAAAPPAAPADSSRPPAPPISR